MNINLKIEAVNCTTKKRSTRMTIQSGLHAIPVQPRSREQRMCSNKAGTPCPVSVTPTTAILEISKPYTRSLKSVVGEWQSTNSPFDGNRGTDDKTKTDAVQSKTQRSTDSTKFWWSCQRIMSVFVDLHSWMVHRCRLCCKTCVPTWMKYFGLITSDPINPIP